MTGYKLTYFNFRGRGEIVRYVFAAAGVAYEDNRIEREQWPELKPTTPFGQIPVLEFDGVKLCQSNTIARFLARRFNLAGKSDLDQARADMIIDCIEDTVNPGYAVFFEKDPTRQAELKKKWLEEQLPASLDRFEKILKENKGGDGYFVGDDLTWADLGLFVISNVVNHIGAGDLLEKRPKLFALHRRVETLPRIAEYLANRPKSDY